MALGMYRHSEVTWPSHDDHATMCHPCHLISRPVSQWTWDLRVPTLFIFTLFLSNCMLILLCLLHSGLHVPVLIPDLEADCMHPCTLFTTLSPSPPCGQPPYLQIPFGLHPAGIHVPVTLWFYSL